MHVPSPVGLVTYSQAPTQPTVLHCAGPGTRERAAELCQGCAASEGGAACPPLARDWQAPPGFTRLPPGYVFLRRAALVCHVAVPGSGFGLCVPAEARPNTAELKASSFRQLGSAPLGLLCGGPRAESCSLAGTCRTSQWQLQTRLPAAHLGICSRAAPRSAVAQSFKRC